MAPTTYAVPNASSSYSAKALCRLVGTACIAGFIVDLLVLAFPPALNSIEWRINFLQQLGDRSIILLFGFALLLFGILEVRVWRKRLALLSLVLGAMLTLSSIAVIRDSVIFQQRAFTAISAQADQARNQLSQLQQNPSAAPNVKPEQLQQAPQLLNQQVETVKQNAKNTVLKTGISSVGNLVVVGIAFIGLGQFGVRPPKG